MGLVPALNAWPGGCCCQYCVASEQGEPPDLHGFCNTDSFAALVTITGLVDSGAGECSKLNGAHTLPWVSGKPRQCEPVGLGTGCSAVNTINFVFTGPVAGGTLTVSLALGNMRLVNTGADPENPADDCYCIGQRNMVTATYTPTSGPGAASCNWSNTDITAGGLQCTGNPCSATWALHTTGSTGCCLPATSPGATCEVEIIPGEEE